MKKNKVKKINEEQWRMLGKYNYAAKWCRDLCTYTLTKETDTKYRRDQFIGWPVYAILFIPVCIITILHCLWDGGLKEFELPPRYLGGDYLWTCDHDGLLEEIYGE